MDGEVTLGNTVTLAEAPEAASGAVFEGWKAPDGTLYSAGDTFLFEDWEHQQDDPDADTLTITMTAQYHFHGFTRTEAKAATCTEDGNIEYWTCNEGDDPCGGYFADADGKKEINEEDTVIKATGHDWGEWEVTTPATATKDGEETRTCKNDPSHTETRVIPRSGGSGGVKIDLRKQNITTLDAVYTGQTVYPIIKVTDAQGRIISPMNYVITYADPTSTAVGTYEYTITGRGMYYGSVTNSYKINPPAKAIKKIKKGKKFLKVKWKKATAIEKAGFDGYQVTYSKKKKFRKAKIRTVKKNTVRKVKIRKLKRKKKYFVKLRTYKIVDGVTYYSAWSKIKKARTKKK